jgi:hypothetical protein
VSDRVPFYGLRLRIGCNTALLRHGRIQTTNRLAGSRFLGEATSTLATVYPYPSHLCRASKRPKDLGGIELFVEASGLGQSGETPQVPTTVSGRPTDELSKPLCLARIDGLSGVNALPTGSALTFDPSLTVIYGRNGAGKSGFARLFANACFSRHKPQIISNIYASGKAPKLSADFHILLNGVAQEPLAFESGVEHPDLKRISFFDITIARLHVSETTAFEFKPSGFDVFPEMARVYGEIGKLLASAIQSRTHTPRFSDSFIGEETEVSKAVSSIGPRTDMKSIRKLAIYGDAEKARFKEVDAQAIALKSKSPQEHIAALKQAQVAVIALIAKLATLSNFFSPDRVAARTEVSRSAKERTDAAALLGTETFKRPFFNAVGTPQWEAFVKAAHALARLEGQTYPTETDRCLLCERPLDEDARAHVISLLAFVEGDIQREAELAAKAVNEEIVLLQSLDTNIFSVESVVRVHLHRLDPELETKVAELIGAIEQLRGRAVTSLLARTPVEGTFDCTAASQALTALVARMTDDIGRLEKDDAKEAIASLELERQTLRHREVLSQLLPSLEKAIEDAAWCAKAERMKTSLSPRPITEKEKELFTDIIGETYRKRLADECKSLNCDLPVELQTAGQKGKTVRSLLMKSGHKPDAILSEGEQRAVALADFLTEVALNPINAGVVLDDPVTSQDHERKQLIAKRLVEESRRRQVIVFTHDLPFLNQLVTSAESEDTTTFQAHWIERHSDGTPGQITLNDAPATSKAYDTAERAKQCLGEAQTLSGRPRHDAICKGMGALRRTIEEVVVKKLLKGVVPRWSDRVIVTGLRNVAWDDGLAEQFCLLYEELSAYIEGHSHTDEAMGAPPEFKDLSDMIPRVEALIKLAKQDKKAQQAVAARA